MISKEIIEPLRNLFKDEVRKAGLELGIPEYLVYRQPFPGPGLGIRIIGEVTADKVRIVQDADYIYREKWMPRWVEEYRHGGTGQLPNQYFAALTNMRSLVLWVMRENLMTTQLHCVQSIRLIL